MSDQPVRHTEAPAAPIRQRARLFGVLALLLATVIFGFGVAPSLFAGAIGWETASATVLDSEVLVTQETEPWGNGVREFDVYTPHITFTYDYAGETYTSSRVTRGRTDANRDPDRAESLVARYPAGAKAICYVNPDNPAEAVLLREESHAVWVYVAGGAILALFGLGAIISTRRR